MQCNAWCFLFFFVVNAMVCYGALLVVFSTIDMTVECIDGLHCLFFVEVALTL